MLEEIELENVVCVKVIYSNDKGFQIAKFKDNSSGKDYTVKGVLFAREGLKYSITGELDKNNAKYKDTYAATDIRINIDLAKAKKHEIEKFFTTVLSKSKAKILANVDGLIDILESNDKDRLMKVDGIGEKYADKILDVYFNQKDLSEAYIYFNDYGFSKITIQKICKIFGSSHIAIETTREDPYSLTKVPGLGFKKVDGAFLLHQNNKGLSINDSRRTKAYIDYLFEEEYSIGNTWLTPIEVIEKVRQFLPNIDLKHVIEYINESDKFLSIDNQNELFGAKGKRITSRINGMREMKIAEEIRRLALSKSTIKLKNVESILEKTQEEQGWIYSDEQAKAIDMLLKQNICLLQGYGGTGKSSVLKGYLDVLKANGYSFEQCALSGKAANNMFLITKQKGSTIHSLARIGTEGQLSQKNPIPADVIILDELSMVDQKVFLALIRAVKTGSKLIMIGDDGQLDSIGAGVMNGIINSKAIPSTTLTQVQRQAKNSAIITHSIDYRSGSIPKELNAKPEMIDTYGENQDLKYMFVNQRDEDKISSMVIREYARLVKIFGVDNTQIMCSTKKAGKATTQKLNTQAQMISNPFNRDKEEFEIKKGEDFSYVLREGDKVINTSNDKDTFDPKGNERPIFNGNTGKLLYFETRNDTKYAVIDFDGIGEVMVSEGKFKNIELGYASTVHKNQGSTIPCVILALPYHFLLNSRELLYTAVTRASKYQVVITSPKTLKSTLKKTSKRTEKTNIDLFIRELNQWKEKLL